MTNNKSSYPIYPVLEPRHFSDYGFDPQFDYFQVLEEAQNHKQEAAFAASSSSIPGSIIDSLHFKLQNPISSSSNQSFSSTDPTCPKKTQTKKKKRIHWHWWKRAFLVFSCSSTEPHRSHHQIFDEEEEDEHDVHHARARVFRATALGPVMHMAQSGTGTPWRQARSRPSSGPLV